MCGRYAMGIRLSFIRYQLQQQGMQVDEAADDGDVRESYNFAPGYYGAVYRADTPDQGGMDPEQEAADGEDVSHSGTSRNAQEGGERRVKYKLQGMKWGLIPFWTKRSPEYSSVLKTINCRDDSLIEDRGMWTSMKRRKRCVVICQGFYEWLKKGPSGKEKVPYFIRRKDGGLLLFAGLWDCVKYEGSNEKIYSYTIITTSSNPYLKFLHDRMPVILDPGSTAMATWLDPHRTTWSKELQSLLKPYEGELECYPVSKEVGKVGNNSPDFIVPINSKENKKNIANFFANIPKNKSEKASVKEDVSKTAKKEEKDGEANRDKTEAENERGEEQETKNFEGSKDNTPPIIPKTRSEIALSALSHTLKREHSPDETGNQVANDQKSPKTPKTQVVRSSPRQKKVYHSPLKTAAVGSRKTRSATSNGTVPKLEDSKKTSHGTQQITNFFKK